jgi:molecular chaperone GrpE
MENTDEKNIEQLLEESRKQGEEYLDGWKRAKADLANLQKDMAREKAEWMLFASSRCLERLLPAIDALEAAAGQDPKFAQLAAKFADYLKGEGVTEIPAQGRYDHSLHEVIGREKREGSEPDAIVIVAQKGYLLHDRVLRTAKVIVAE